MSACYVRHMPKAAQRICSDRITVFFSVMMYFQHENQRTKLIYKAVNQPHYQSTGDFS